MPQSDALTPPPARFGLIPLTELTSLRGMDVLQGMLAGRYPMPPIQEASGFALTQIEPGQAVFMGTPQQRFYNPISTVHAGWTSTVLDSAMACAVWSTLEAGLGFTTMEFKISLVRPITVETGPIRAESNLLSRGKRAATAEARMTDGAGRLLAHATTTCIIFANGAGG
ncbi:MAG: PaaI family thioesterase [Hyphomicrobiaceae bacterium]|jgi:uncharacterized protein (TIGR00369 family)|nr:PaaI family thioesterase [Hyphomicrobiaceae bacterium]